MKKTESAIDKVKREREIKERMDEIRRELGTIPNIQSRVIEAGEWYTRLQSFIRQNGGSEASIPDSRRAEYLSVKEQAETKRADVNELKEKDACLRQELTKLEEELGNFQYQAAANEVIEYQEKVASIKEDINTLVHAISREEEKQQKAKEPNPVLVELKRRREDIMAEMAIGGKDGDRTELKKIEDRIAEEQKKADELKDAASSAGIAIMGLKRKLEAVQASLKTEEQNLEALFTQYLIAEVEKEGKEYVKLADEFAGKFKRIMALSKMISDKKGPSITTWAVQNFKIPGFTLNACKDAMEGDNIFDYQKVNQPEEVESVRQSIKGLGINLT